MTLKYNSKFLFSVNKILINKRTIYPPSHFVSSLFQILSFLSKFFAKTLFHMNSQIFKLSTVDEPINIHETRDLFL